MSLIKHADSQVPFVSMVAFCEFDPKSHFRRMCEPLDLLSQAQDTKGEIRARAIIRAIRETAEMLYDPYLRIILQLERFGKRKWPKMPREFGDLVRVAHKRLSEFPGLVDKDASWLRNSASHAQWEYLPKKDRIIMWDRKTPPTDVAVKELKTKVENMYLISGMTIMYVNQIYYLRDYFIGSGLADEMCAAFKKVASNGVAENVEVAREISKELQERFDPLRSFLEEKKSNLTIWPLK